MQITVKIFPNDKQYFGKVEEKNGEMDENSLKGSTPKGHFQTSLHKRETYINK